MSPEWVRSLRDQCVAGGIKFHFKQYGNWKPITLRQVNGHKTTTIALSTGEKVLLANMGKKKAGRVLDGKTWNELPARLVP